MLSLLRTSSNLKSVGYQLRHVTMDSSISQLKHLFAGAVDAVKPGAMFERYLRDESVLRQLQNADKNYHLVGFGKAVLGMAVQMERILGDRLTSGCISIPVGTLERFRGEQDFQLSRASKIQVLECAANNLPDEAAVEAAQRIQSVAASMTANDVLCVLVSGGGSALLPLPKSPINLTEKLTIIKQLASAGASIDELNVVRIQLSDVKGGKLASSASKSNKVLSFIISDIIGDPLELIASGPTVQSDFSNEDALNILKKYSLVDKLPKSVEKVLTRREPDQRVDVQGEIHLIGTNKLAIESVTSKATESDLLAIPMSTRVQGNVAELSQAYFELASAIVKFRQQTLTESEFIEQISENFKTLNFDHSKIPSFIEALAKNPDRDILLVSGGEPTVIVKGTGLGGRNQELALRFSVQCFQQELLKGVLLLSAGTDGIDGPTDAAGAIGGAEVVERFQMLDCEQPVEEFISNNDSYSFYRQVDKGRFHVVTGHTGTNVMDIQMLLIPKIIL